MKKRILSILLAITLAFTVVGCNKSTKPVATTDKTKESSEDSFIYNISALLSEDNEYDDVLLKGFSDALSDYIGEEHIKITKSVVSEEHSSDDLAEKAASKSCDMIFTAGKPTLLSSVAATESVPIIATGIVDFQGTLRIASLHGKSWDKTTGINVTGVSSKPSIVDQVSLMIEATDDLQTVGILFSPEDTDSIYQNEIFEAYLDQAGIPWKEYIVPATSTADVAPQKQNSTALTPSKFVAFSAKEGMNNQVESLGEDNILGLNSPSSTRAATVSSFWTGGKKIASPEDENGSDIKDSNNASTDNSKEKKNAVSDKDKEELLTEVSDSAIAQRIKEACDECSVIYVPFGSMQTDQMDIIGKVCLDSRVVLVAGDATIGANSLVTLFADPYAIGYAAGKKAVRVFNGEDISTIKVSSIDGDDAVKLYNGTIAQTFKKEFPKSFQEYNQFLETYKYGSTITRHSNEENEKK